MRLRSNLLVTMENLTRALDLQKKGETQVATPFEIPKKGHSIGVGFWGLDGASSVITARLKMGCWLTIR